MMLIYYGYAMPLSLRIGRGFYEDGIWSDAGFVPYSKIGGLTWREGGADAGADRPDADFARRLPSRSRSTARRAACSATRSPRTTSISPGKSLDLGLHDERTTS